MKFRACDVNVTAAFFKLFFQPLQVPPGSLPSMAAVRPLFIVAGVGNAAGTGAAAA